MSQVVVRWKEVSYGTSYWQDANGKEVAVRRNFFAYYQGQRILVVMSDHYSPPGHGEPSHAYMVPHYLDATSLEDLNLSGIYVEVEEAVETPKRSKKYMFFTDLTSHSGALPIEGEYDTLQEVIDAVVKAENRDKWDWLYIVNTYERRGIVLTCSAIPFAQLTISGDLVDF